MMVRRARKGGALGNPKSLFLSTAIVALACGSAGPAVAQSVAIDPIDNDVTAPDVFSTPVWTIIGDLLVGDTASGKLTIEDGGIVDVDGTSYVGDDMGSQGTVLVSGQDGSGNAATWTNSGDLVVAQSGTGAMTIQNGGVVDNQTAYIGAGADSLGSVTILGRGSDGAASTWTSRGNLIVGDVGTGELIIQGGGAVSANDISYVGRDTDGNGTVTVSGQDGSGNASTWINNNDLVIGQFGTGTMTISNGGIVSNQTGYIGASTGSTGAVTVTGRGSNGVASTWTNLGDLNVGDAGTGTLTVQDGGLVNVNSNLSVGFDGTGTLNITSGGKVVSDRGSIGNGAGLGEALVTGTGSSWEATGRISVGLFGAGTFRIEDGATVTSGDGTVGDGAHGDVVLSGPGTSWTNGGLFTVGSFATGTLRIENGASLISNQGYIGANADGSVVVTGAGSSWVMAPFNLTVGHNANGSLTIEDGALVRAEDGVGLGTAAGVNGTLTLQGTTANRAVLETSGIGAGLGNVSVTIDGGLLRATASNSDFFSGFAGRDISLGANGVIVDTQGYDIFVSPRFTGTGGLIKDGTGWLVLTGANNYTGGTTVSAGALRLAGGGQIAGGPTRISGVVAGSDAQAIVTGAGSSWTTDTLDIGLDGGDGMLTITAGGTVNQISGATVIGSGGLAVTGTGSSFSTLDDLLLGRQTGTSTITVSGGAHLSAGRSYIGEGPGTTMAGTITAVLDGSGSLWDAGGFVGVGSGSGGSASLTISGGATMMAADPVAISAIGYGGQGSAIVTDAGSQFLLGGTTTLAIGEAAGGGNGNGTLTIRNGGLVSAQAVTMGAFDAATTGVLNLEGTAGARGVLQTAGLTRDLGDATVNVNGGVLRASANSAAFLAGFNPGDITIQAGGLFLDTNGFDVTASSGMAGTGALTKQGSGTLIFTQASSYTGGTTIETGILQLGDGGTTGSITGNVINNGALIFNRSDEVTFAGTIGGTGTLSQLGGTLILTGPNSYAGATNIVAGALLVNGDQSAATALTSVASGAALGGIGTIGGDVSIANGAHLNPGAAGTTPGALTIHGNLALASGATLNYDLGQADIVGGALNDLVTVGGDLVLDGTLDVTVSAGGKFDPGIYRIFDYGGTLIDHGLLLGAMPAGSTSTVQTSIAGQVNLLNSEGLLFNFWDGAVGPKSNNAIDGGDGRWQNGSGNDNWTDANGIVNAAYSDGAFAIFAGKSGAVTVDNSLGTVGTTGLQFASGGYMIAGDALTLVGPQSTIRVGDGTAAGAGMTATISAGLTGASRLVKTDAGTLVLSGANSYTGGTQITGGTLRISADNNLGAAGGGVDLDGGTLHTTADLASARAVSLTGDGTILTEKGTTFAVKGPLSGTGALTKDGAGVLLLTGNNSPYVAAARVLGGTLAIDGAIGSTATVSAAGRLEGNGRVGGVVNAGVVAPGRGGIGTLTVLGNYAGNGGTLEIEAALGDDSSATDRLVVNGGTSGVTQVAVINRGGLGAPTVEGIKIIDVSGASDGSFALKGDYVFQGQQTVIGGAYGYRLYRNGASNPADGDWYLRSTLLVPLGPESPALSAVPLYQPGVPLYEGYTQTLLALNSLSSLQQRVGNRSWAGGSVQAGTGIWGRMDAARHRPQAVFSSSFADKNIDSWQMQMGVDATLGERSDGATLIGSLTAHYGKADAAIGSVFGNGSIATQGYGVGATLTWYGPQGFYVDGQVQLSWFDSDLKSVTLGTLVKGNGGEGKAFGLEVGKRSPIGGKLTVTPQIQMIYSQVDFDRFVDPAGAIVSKDEGESLKTRWGFSLDHQSSWGGGAGDTRRSHVYGIVNISYDWLGSTRVDVSGTEIANGDHRLWGELGLGGSYSWGTDRFTLYSEIAADTPIADFAEGYSLRGSAGVRVRF